MLGAITKGLSLAKKLVTKDDKPSPSRITAVILAGAGLVGAILISSGVSPELAHAVEEFVAAIGLLSVDP